MAPEYEDISREISLTLWEQFKRKGEDVQFATRMLAERVLPDTELKRIYQSLRTSEELPIQPSGSANLHDEDSFVQNIKKKKLHDFLAVLLYAHCTKSAAQSFKAKLVFGDEPNVNLPVSEQDLRLWFGEPSDISQFMRRQKYFCTIVIGFPEDIILQAGDPRRKPWLSETYIDGGSDGYVFAVEIAEHHFTEDRTLEGTRTGVTVVARKDFPMGKRRSFEKEVQVMKEIRNNRTRNNNILNSFGTLTIEGDKPEFSLFMPKAETSLNKYFSKSRRGGVPLSMEERHRLITSAIGLAEGLDFLHTKITAKGIHRRVCFHMDLKPGNVLVFPNDHGEEHDIWKISDFGMSKVKDMPHSTPTKDDILTDFQELFKKRSKVNTAEASKTVIERGPETYLPSEALDPGKSMNEKSDVWALGCILSVTFTFMEFQSQGVEEYEELRLNQGNRRKDSFYGKSFMGRSFPINVGVVEQHRALVKAAAQRGSAEKKAVQSMLDFLKDKVFVERQDKRCTAIEVSEKLQETLEGYGAVIASQAGGTEERSRIFNLIPGLTTNDHATLASGITVSPEFVSWRLNKYKATRSKGCDCSPNGAFIAFWDEEEIMVFTKSHAGKQELLPVDKEGRKPDESDRVWKAIKLTDRYLFAITTGSEHNCYIFDMELAGNLTAYNVLSLPESETGLLDVSPDLESFMCIRKTSSGRSLFYSATIQPCIMERSKVRRTTAHGQKKADAGISTFDEKEVLLAWQAKDVLRLISHSKNKGYIAFQRQNTPLILSIAFFCVDEVSHIEAKLDETNFLGETTSLFTDMIYRSNDSTGSQVLVVLDTKRISQIGFTDLETKATISAKSPLGKYRILGLTIDQSSGKIVALGVRSMYDNVCLLEIKWRDDTTVVQVMKRLAVLEKLSEADEPKVRICQGGGQRIALITALTSNSRSAVYQVSLDGSSRA